MPNAGLQQPLVREAQPRQSGGTLVFREAPHDYYLVFTSLDRALEIDRLQRALASATWGEFRRQIGAAEYARLFEEVFEKPPPDTDAEELDKYELEPPDDAPFNSERVPGFSDGDYPPWLAAEMQCHLPASILQRFARYDSSVINGPFYRVMPENRDAIIKALVDAGYKVEERTDLQFW